MVFIQRKAAENLNAAGNGKYFSSAENVNAE